MLQGNVGDKTPIQAILEIRRNGAMQLDKLNYRMKELVDQIERNYLDIRVSRDEKTSKFLRHYDYSVTIEALPGEIDILRAKFPNFKFTHITNKYHQVYFNKPDNWGELRMPDLE